MKEYFTIPYGSRESESCLSETLIRGGGIIVDATEISPSTSVEIAEPHSHFAIDCSSKYGRREVKNEARSDGLSCSSAF